MKAIALFLLWVTLLAIPLHAIGLRWREQLWRTHVTLTEWAGMRPEPIQMPRSAPLDVALFAAMALASGRLPWRTRLRALAIGIPILAACELASLTASAGLLRISRYGALGPAVTGKLMAIPAYTMLFVVPFLLWSILLGRPYLRAESPALGAPRRARP